MRNCPLVGSRGVDSRAIGTVYLGTASGRVARVSISSKSEFDTAVKRAREAATAYYDSSALLMSDAEYDALVDEIAEAHAQHPTWDDRGVLTQVAAGSSAGGTTIHPTPMLSMDKTTTADEVSGFLAKHPSVAWCVEAKLDGVAVRANYEAGRLVALTTRGDGTTGEALDPTLEVSGLPHTVSTADSFEVRGEVFMTDTDFEKSNANRVAAGKSAFANARNATAGTLRRETVRYRAYLSFAAYDATGKPFDSLDSYLKRGAAAAKLGFETVVSLMASHGIPVVPLSDTSAIQPAIAALGEARDSLPFGIDGAVVKADSMMVRDRLGVGTRAPKWAVAYKYPPMEGSSTLADIEVAVGRTGRMSLTGILEPPVLLDGSTVGRATLHNPAFIAQQGLGLGSRVVVVKRGDIIPRITAALGSAASGVTPWVPPAVHDVCGQPWNTSEVVWRCDSPECSTVARITYFASRDVMDVDGLGVEVATALVEAGLVNDVADLFSLPVDQVASVQMGTTPSGKPRLIGRTVAKKLVDGVESSKSQPLNRVVTGLGIRKMGRTMGRRIATHFGTLDAMRSATLEQFMAVEGVAAEKAQAYVSGFASMSSVIDKLVAAGVSTSVDDSGDADAQPLAGMRVVVTGSMAGSKLDGLNRTQMQELIERAGGKASGSVSKTTSLLVCGEEGSSKHKKALELGVRVATPDEFVTLLGL